MGHNGRRGTTNWMNMHHKFTPNSVDLRRQRVTIIIECGVHFWLDQDPSHVVVRDIHVNSLYRNAIVRWILTAG